MEMVAVVFNLPAPDRRMVFWDEPFPADLGINGTADSEPGK